MILDSLRGVVAANALITAFMFVGALVWVSYLISAKLTRGHVHGSAIAIALGLVLAWYGGLRTGGSTGYPLSRGNRDHGRGHVSGLRHRRDRIWSRS